MNVVELADSDHTAAPSKTPNTSSAAPCVDCTITVCVGHLTALPLLRLRERTLQHTSTQSDPQQNKISQARCLRENGVGAFRPALERV